MYLRPWPTRMSSMRGRGWASVTVASFRALKSTTPRHLPPFLATTKVGLLQALWPGSTFPSRSHSSTISHRALCLSPVSLMACCFFGTVPGLSSMRPSPKGPRGGLSNQIWSRRTRPS